MIHSRDIGPVTEPRGTTVPTGRNIIAAIGIDRYQHWQQLTNAVRDAIGTVELFEQLGFEQITAPLLNEAATGKAIQSLVTDDLAALRPDDSLVLFYAGHGTARNRRVGDQQVKTGCLLAFDASPMQNKVSAWVDLEVWLHAVSLLPAKHILVVLDACHSGIALDPLIKWRAGAPGPDEPLPELHARCSRRVITSALHGQVALDSGPIRGHSLFTGCLIEGLTHGIPAGRSRQTTGSALGLYVQQRVQSYPNSQQTPDFGAFGLDDRGEILLPLLSRESVRAINTIALPRTDGGGRTAAHDATAADSGVYIGWSQSVAESAEDADVQRDSPGNPPSSTAELDRSVPLATATAIPPSGDLHGQSSARRAAASARAVPRSRSSGKRKVLLSSAGVLVLIVSLSAAWHSLRSDGGGSPTPPPPVEHAIEGSPATGAVPPQPPSTPRGRRKIVVGVNDFGGAYPGVVANDGALAGLHSLFTEAGLDVEIRWIPGSANRLAAFDAGTVDIMLLTVDYLANLAPHYHEKNQDVKAFLMVDWSRGNLGIIATPEIRSIEGLKDARIATTIHTPTHYLLLTLLEMSSLGPEEVKRVKANIEPMQKTPLAGPPFERNELQAAVLWDPYLSHALAQGKGHLLISTATATHLVADVLFARESFLTEHEAEMTAFVRAWLQGVTLLDGDPERWVAKLAAAFHQQPDTVRDLIRKTKPATFVDNREFFGLERQRAPYFDLFDLASRLWQGEGVITVAADAKSTRWTKPLEALLGEHSGDRAPKEFAFTGCPATSATPLLTRNVSIHFGTDRFALDPTARDAIDGLSRILDRFGNACVRVVGHTDGAGTVEHNKWLSEKRASSVVDYLAERFDRARFQPVGNGPEGPAGSNAASRRTDFHIIANDCAGAACQAHLPH